MIVVSENVSIDKLNYVVDKYNKTYHRTIKSLFMYIKPIHRSLFMLKQVHILTLILKVIIKILVIM